MNCIIWPGIRFQWKYVRDGRSSFKWDRNECSCEVELTFTATVKFLCRSIKHQFTFQSVVRMLEVLIELIFFLDSQQNIFFLHHVEQSRLLIWIFEQKPSIKDEQSTFQIWRQIITQNADDTLLEAHRAHRASFFISRFIYHSNKITFIKYKLKFCQNFFYVIIRKWRLSQSLFATIDLQTPVKWIQVRNQLNDLVLPSLNPIMAPNSKISPWKVEVHKEAKRELRSWSIWTESMKIKSLKFSFCETFDFHQSNQIGQNNLKIVHPQHKIEKRSFCFFKKIFRNFIVNKMFWCMKFGTFETLQAKFCIVNNKSTENCE